MRRSLLVSSLFLGAILGSLWIPLASAAHESPTEPSREMPELTLSAERPVDAPEGPWEGRFMAFADPGLEKASGRTIPTFTRSIVARGRTYQYTMVGSDPFVKNAKNVTVPVKIIPVRFEFDDGSVFDPTVAALPCQGGGVPLSMVQASPVFKNVDYGDGPRQFVEVVRRLEFWTLTGAAGAINPGYSVRVSPSVLATARIKATGFPTRSFPCGKVGLIDVGSWDGFVRTSLFPQLRRLGVTTQMFPLFLFTNVVLYDGDTSHCCILGYHTAFNSAGIQTYGIADFDTSGTFRGPKDVSSLSHELAEWYDDPFGNNATPPWGHTGQQDGCQSNLENGDPLSGSLHQVVVNGVTFHPQEIAFFSWFYNQVPSMGVNGVYSSGGTFVAPAELCH